MTAGTVIIGGGQAGYQCAVSLRSAGYTDPISLICEEPYLPYQRPPLSKAFLKGKQAEEALVLRPESYYQDNNIDLYIGNPATVINRKDKRVVLQDGEPIGYDKLVYATGAPAFMPAISGTELDGVLLLRDLQQAKDIKARLSEAKSIVIIGGGFIGMEVAAVAADGREVTVFESLDRIMARVTAPVISEHITALHTQNGVSLECNAQVSEICGEHGKVKSVVTASGKEFPADLVVVGVGVRPEVALADAAGLHCDNGVQVDEFCRTNDEDIYAIGDCANHFNEWADGFVRLESIQNATDQARCVAATICSQPTKYSHVPWFWTEQFSARLQMVGLSTGYTDTVVRGDREAGAFSVFYFKGDKLLAIDSVNRPVDHMAGRKILGNHLAVTKQQAEDMTFNFKTLYKKAP